MHLLPFGVTRQGTVLLPSSQHFKYFFVPLRMFLLFLSSFYLLSVIAFSDQHSSLLKESVLFRSP